MVGLEGKRVGGVSIGAPGKDGPEKTRKYPTGAVSGRGNHWAQWMHPWTRKAPGAPCWAIGEETGSVLQALLTSLYGWAGRRLGWTGEEKRSNI